MAEHGAVVIPFAHEGALSGDWVISWELPYAFMPRHVSFVGTNASDATLDLGVDGGAEVIDDMAAGDSGNPAEYGPSDFEDADYQFSKGDVMTITVTYGGAGGTAIQDPTIVVTGLLGA